MAFVRLEHDERGFSTLTITSPENRNALTTEEDVHAFVAAVDEIAARPETRAPVITGEALRMSKRVLRDASTSSLASSLESAAALQAIAHFSEEHRLRVPEAVARTSQSTGSKPSADETSSTDRKVP